MDISKQVCCLEHAKRLKELGIEQNSLFFYNTFYNTSSTSPTTLFTMLNNNNETHLDEDGEEKSYIKEHNCYSAFTVPELGKMLAEIDNGNIDATSFYNWRMGFWECLITKMDEGGERVTEPSFIEEETEAGARAEALIHLLENNLTTATECNERINK